MHTPGSSLLSSSRSFRPSSPFHSGLRLLATRTFSIGPAQSPRPLLLSYMQIAFIFIASSLLPFGIHKPRRNLGVRSGLRLRHDRTETALPWHLLVPPPADQGMASSFRH